MILPLTIVLRYGVRFVLFPGADSQLLKDGRVAAIQSVSGTGALRLAGAYLARFWPEGTPKPKVFLPNPVRRERER
jgi:aspartate/tyrosine/aromatic aminotransferase